jgi:hypothetical protein
VDELRAKLTASLGPTDWPPLGPHARRQALFEVHDLELVEVGLAIARDRSAIVEHWLASGSISRPSAERVAAFEVDESARFETLIVQPFVLFRPVGPES